MSEEMKQQPEEENNKQQAEEVVTPTTNDEASEPEVSEPVENVAKEKETEAIEGEVPEIVAETVEEEVVEVAEATVENAAEAPEGIAEDAKEEPVAAESEEPAVKAEEPVAVEETQEESQAESDENTEEGDAETIEDEPAHDENEVLPDYSTFSRTQLVETIEELTHQDTFKRSFKILELIEPLFKAMEDAARQEAMDKYIADGGEEDSFEFRHDEEFNRFDASLKLIRDRRSAFYKEREAAKTRNLEKKEELLIKLRDLVDGENATTNIKPIKEIQESWKAIGPVPPQQNKTLWANYNALLDRFYSNRNILFELKELDRKKNYATKLDLCEKAEALDKLESVKDAVIQLNDLHEEYKRVGAVPREVQEELWQRFKAASDTIYKKRKVYLDHLKTDLKDNLVKKEELIKELQEYTRFDSDRINDWNAKTKEILVLQKKWDAIGGVPRENAKSINKAFWSSFKKFFANKNEFFKKLEGLRKENLEKKRELVAKAVELKDSTDFHGTADKIKALQREWKEIGPVPEKQRNEVYDEFKKACDEFFNNLRSNKGEAEAQYLENQKAKEILIQKINEAAEAKEGSEEDLLKLAQEYQALGYVPRNAVKDMEKRYAEAVAAYVASIGLEDMEAETLAMKAEMAGNQNSGAAEKKIYKKESALRREINEIEDNISLWKNNLAFFANSKTADKLKEEFDGKIASAEEDLAKLKKQLKALRSI